MEEIVSSFFYYCIHNRDFYLNIVKPYMNLKYFDYESFKDIYNIIKDLYEKHGDIKITENTLRNECDKEDYKVILSSIYNLEEPENLNYVIYCFKRTLIKGILSDSLISSNNIVLDDVDRYKDIHSIMFDTFSRLRDIEEVSLDGDPLDFRDELESILDTMKELYSTENLCTTGLPTLDTILGGGFGKGEVHIAAASQAKGGKSRMLTFITKSNLLIGKKILFITLELKANEVKLNIVSSFTDMTYKDMINDPDEYKSRVSIIKNINPTLQVSYFSDFSITTDQIDIECGKFIEKYGELDLLVIDYADLIKPTSFGAKNTYEAIGDVYRGLINIADKYQIPVITASQLNREGYQQLENKVHGAEKLSDSIEKARKVYSVITLSSNDAERMQNKARLYVSLNRRGPMGNKIFVEFNRAKCTMKEIQPYDPRQLT